MTCLAYREFQNVKRHCRVGKTASTWACFQAVAIYSAVLSVTPRLGKHTCLRLISASIWTHSDCDESVYLLASVCGDSQAIGHQACCFMLFHQAHRDNGEGHLQVERRRWKRAFKQTNKTFFFGMNTIYIRLKTIKHGGSGSKCSWGGKRHFLFRQYARNVAWIRSLLSVNYQERWSFKEMKKKKEGCIAWKKKKPQQVMVEFHSTHMAWNSFEFNTDWRSSFWSSE